MNKASNDLRFDNDSNNTESGNVSLTKKCKGCGMYSTQDAVYCPDCGEIYSPEAIVKDDDNISKSQLANNIGTIIKSYAPIHDISDKIVCSSCGKPVMAFSIYCSHCGIDVSVENTNKLIERKVCPQCDHINPIGQDFCNYCFSSLSDSPIAVLKLQCVNSDSKPKSLKQIVYVDITLPDRTYKECPHCFTLNDPSSDLCYYCGNNLVRKYLTKLCFNCGYNNETDVKSCSKCTALLSANIKEWKCTCGYTNERDSKFCCHCGNSKGDL